ncbi:MAG: EamA family transporter [Anaerolineales bacterium]|jgi:DME family drug/metabolite transporter
MNFDPDSQRKTGSLLVLGAAVLWGTTGTAQALAPDSATPLIVGAIRMAIGGAALLVIALARGAFSQSQGIWSLKAIALGGLGLAAYQITFFSGVARTGVAIGTLVAIGSAPILAGLAETLIDRRPPGKYWGIATLMGILGAALLVTSGSSLSLDLAGMALAIGAGGSYALYTLASKRLLRHHSPDAAMAVVFCLAGVLMAPVFLTQPTAWMGETRGWLVALHLGLITTALAYVLYGRGLKETSVSSTVTLSLAEPLTAALLGVFFLGEPFTLQAVAGAALIFLGLLLLTRGTVKLNRR